MNRQAEEAGRLADELHEKLIASNGNTDIVASAPEQPKDQTVQAPGESANTGGTPEYADLEKKFKVLQGKYNAEVPLLHAQLREAKEKAGSTSDLESKVADLERQLADAKSELEKKADITSDRPDEIVAIEREYGASVADVIHGLQMQVKSLQTHISSQQAQEKPPETPSQPQEVGLTDAEKAVMSRKIGMVANYLGISASVYDADEQMKLFSSIDSNNQFTSWLDQKEHPSSPETRRDTMGRLFHGGDYEGVASYYVEFYQSSQKESSNAQLLEEQEQPGTNSRDSSMNGNANNGRVWRMSEIRDYQKKFSVDPYYKTPEGQKEADELEEEFIAASREGRISSR